MVNSITHSCPRSDYGSSRASTDNTHRLKILARTRETERLLRVFWCFESTRELGATPTLTLTLTQPPTLIVTLTFTLTPTPTATLTVTPTLTLGTESGRDRTIRIDKILKNFD